MRRPRDLKLLFVVLALAVVAAATGTATFAAFVSLTSNAGNSFESGTVSISDNDAAAALLSIASGKPGNSDTGCIRVTYGGSLDASVRLYASVSGALAPYMTLTVTRGTDAAPSFDSCKSFTADVINYIGAGAGVIYSGTLSGFPAAYDGGIVDPETWATSAAHSYKFVVSVNDDTNAQGLSSSVDFHWEARNT
jgi:hypothetical protein